MNRNKKSICTIILIVINVVVFFALSFIGQTEDGEFMLRFGASYTPYVIENKEYYRLFTSMFLHFGFQHLANNMVMLGFVGWNVEAEAGKVRFLIIYLLSGLIGNIVSTIWDLRTVTDGGYAVSAGASGAVYGIIGCALGIALLNKGRIGNLSQRGLIIMILLGIYYGATAGNIDNAAHIGGLVSGFLLTLIIYRRQKTVRSDY
ncbi:MAG: rhomboid family intramembrane serine protease [Lachnospiraceae bacterium]|nr:rhomboid family intramembrane serine protease [Lachnospiraceae bacterium]